MKIAIDSHIPFIEGVFEPFGIDVVYSESIDPAECDALIIRTRTKCDAKLLDAHSPRIISTATIGYDHIDVQYCRDRGIEVATAAGCNARGVAQWVFAALIQMGVKEPSDHTIGIIGVGNVGSVVAAVARSVGFRVLMCDPPRAVSEPGFVSLDELLRNSDIVTIHTPLDETTRSMADAVFFAQMKSGAIFLNSSRGEVVDEQALLDSHISKFALDVWYDEPRINLELLRRATIATPHIAGYSAQGKAMGTAMSVRSVARKLGITELIDWYPSQIEPTTPNISIDWQTLVCEMPKHYIIGNDSAALRREPKHFEQLRSNYNYRHEFF